MTILIPIGLTLGLWLGLWLRAETQFAPGDVGGPLFDFVGRVIVGFGGALLIWFLFALWLVMA